MTISLNPVEKIDTSTATVKDLKVNFDVLCGNQIILRDYVCSIEDLLCDLANLETEDKTCIVNAINEIHNDLDLLEQELRNLIQNITDNFSPGTLVDNGDGTYTYNNGSGTITVIDTRAPSNPINPITGLPGADNVQEALEALKNQIDNIDVTDQINNILANQCLTPTNSTGDGRIRFAVFEEDDSGCIKLRSYSTSDAPLDVSNWGEITNHVPDNTDGYVLPDDFNNGGGYTFAQLLTDDNNGNGAPSGGSMAAQVFASSTFNNTLGRNLEYTLRFTNEQSAYANATEAFQAQGYFVRRYKIGNGPWIYNRNGSGTITTSHVINGLGFEYVINDRVFLPAGNITLQFVYMAKDGSTDPVSIIANTYLAGSGFAPRPLIEVRNSI